MAYRINKSLKHNGYIINGKGILTDNIPYHKRKLIQFTNAELIALEDYIKAEQCHSTKQTKTTTTEL